MTKIIHYSIFTAFTVIAKTAKNLMSINQGLVEQTTVNPYSGIQQ